MLRFIIATTIFVLNLAPVLAGPLEDASAAERRDDYATAIPIYRSLAEQGVVAAYKRLGYLYYIGVGVKKDWRESAKWYGKAVDAGDKDAAGSLGGIGRNWRLMFRTPIDPIVYELVERAAKKGFLVAQYSLGVINFPMGDAAFDQTKGNLQEALKWYRLAAERGDLDSQASLGYAYLEGIGVLQDYVEAHKWYNIASANQNNPYPDIRTDLARRRDEISQKMTSGQLAEAQKLAREWKPIK